MPTAALQLTDLEKAFGEGDSRTVALDRATLTGFLGEMLFLVGPSGCGKTTLLSILAGTLGVDSGQANVLGLDLLHARAAELTRFRAKNVGFIFQQFNLIPTLTIAENVSVPLLIQGVSHAKATKEAQAMLERVGLGNRSHERPGKLSGGQQQRVAIARALIHQPALVVCDEPTSALDRDNGTKVMELLKEVACQPTRTVVIVTHDPRIYHFADRMAEMEDGRITRILSTPAEIASAHPL